MADDVSRSVCWLVGRSVDRLVGRYVIISYKGGMFHFYASIGALVTFNLPFPFKTNKNKSIKISEREIGISLLRRRFNHRIIFNYFGHPPGSTSLCAPVCVCGDLSCRVSL